MKCHSTVRTKNHTAPATVQGRMWAWKIYHENPDMARAMCGDIVRKAAQADRKTERRAYNQGAAEVLTRLLASELAPASKGLPKDKDDRRAYGKRYLSEARQCGIPKDQSSVSWISHALADSAVFIPLGNTDKLPGDETKPKRMKLLRQRNWTLLRQTAQDIRRETTQGHERQVAQQVAGKTVLRHIHERFRTEPAVEYKAKNDQRCRAMSKSGGKATADHDDAKIIQTIKTYKHTPGSRAGINAAVEYATGQLGYANPSAIWKRLIGQPKGSGIAGKQGPTAWHKAL